MKFVIVFSFCFLCQLVSIAQCDTSIVGEWKALEVFSDQFYINLETDSSLLKPALKEKLPDTNSQVKLISQFKNVYKSAKYIFEKNGSYKYYSMGLVDSGKYCLDAKLKKIQFLSKNSRGEEVSHNSNSKLENGLLYMYEKFDNGSFLNLVLEKRK